MQLAVHSDAVCLNEHKAKSRTCAHIYFSEDAPILTFNGAVLAISQIIKHIMPSTAESELAFLFLTARKCVALRLALIEMR